MPVTDGHQVRNRKESNMVTKTITLLASALLAMPLATAVAGKPSGGSAIRVADLGKPTGSVMSGAGGINDVGNVVVGGAYWDATLDYPNRNYAVRWTRSTSGAWQAEDLRTLIANTKESGAMQVNNAGTVTVKSLDTVDSQYHSLVITGSSVVIDLGANVFPNDLNEAGAMVGYRYDPGGQPLVPLFWPSPSIAPQVLPVLAAGYGGQASWFNGTDIVGTSDDASGRWLVRWSASSGTWRATPIVKLPAGTVAATGINSAGRLALWVCDPFPCDLVQKNARAAVWDPPYTQLPTYLPTLAGPKSYSGVVMEDGAVVGRVIASNGVDMLPVIWPTPVTITALPLLTGGKAGGVGRVNAYRQITGSVDVPVKGRSTSHAVVWTLP
jgi:hypothetical protein